MRALAITIATVGGVGYLPVAPGTWGALVALPMLPLLARLRALSPGSYAAVLVAAIAAAIWAAGRAESILGSVDDARIVIDEFAGVLVAGAFVPGTWLAAALAFVLFRVFDAWKPYPADVFDRRVHGGIGVVGDDLVAGAYAGVVARLALGYL